MFYFFTIEKKRENQYPQKKSQPFGKKKMFLFLYLYTTSDHVDSNSTMLVPFLGEKK